MKNFIAFLGILFNMALWVLPIIVIFKFNGANGWTLLYIPIIVFTGALWAMLAYWYE